MVGIYGFTLVFLVFLAAGISLELVVFNEEIALALCFIFFIFFAYGYLNKVVFSIFASRANGARFELVRVLSSKFLLVSGTILLTRWDKVAHIRYI